MEKRRERKTEDGRGCERCTCGDWSKNRRLQDERTSCQLPFVLVGESTGGSTPKIHYSVCNEMRQMFVPSLVPGFRSMLALGQDDDSLRCSPVIH